MINQYKSPRIFAIEVKKKVSQDAPLYIYADRMNDFNFYLERRVIPVLSKPEDLARLGKHDELVYLLIRDRDLDRAQVEVRSLWKRIISGSTGRKKWNLMRSRGVPQATEETSRRL